MNSAYKLIALILLCSTQVISAQNENFKAIFIYNFTKYIEWPEESQSSDFIITVLGKSDIISELESVAKQHQVNSKPIIIQRADAISAISSTKILFVPKDKMGDIVQLVELCNRKHMLLVTEKSNSCALGAAINFVSKNGSLSFEVQRGNIEKTGLKVNSQLLNLGTVVQ